MDGTNNAGIGEVCVPNEKSVRAFHIGGNGTWKHMETIMTAKREYEKSIRCFADVYEKTSEVMIHSIVVYMNLWKKPWFYSESPSAKLRPRSQSNGTYMTWSVMQPASCRFTRFLAGSKSRLRIG